MDTLLSPTRPTTDRAITPALLVTLALLSAVAPFATDLYLPAFPTMVTDLHTTATAVQLTQPAPMTAMHNLTGGHLPLGQHPQMETGPMVGHQECGHVGHVHPQSHPVARHPGLGDFEDRGADPVAITVQTSSSGSPSTVKFSPKWPGAKSFRPSSVLQ